MGQLGGLSPEASVAIGILVGLLSTSIQSLGLTLQRKSHLLEDDKESYEVRRPPYKRRRWQLGMGMFILSNIVGSTIQITTLPLPVLSTLQASGLVFNTAFATILLDEPFTRFSLIGTILTCTGAALIAVFGAIPEPAHTLPQLLDLLSETQFILWMVGTLVVVVGNIVFAHLLKIWSKRLHEKHSKSGHQPSPGIARAMTGISIKIPLPHAAQIRSSRLRLFRGLSYALISGVLSAHSLLVAKSAVELIVRTIIDHVNQFHSYQSWLILLALLFFALSQLYYLHLGLRLCSTSVLYPFVFCVYNIIAILDGLIYFRQTSRISPTRAGLITLGTVILLSGVLALSWRLDDSQTVEAQQTPLGPGMGVLRSVTDDQGERENSPLLPSIHPRSPTSKRSSSIHINESTPLLTHRPRKSTLLIYPPPPQTGDAQQIWAELDDSDSSGGDMLASLPRSISPYLSPSTYRISRQRRTSDSPSQSPASERKKSTGPSTSNLLHPAPSTRPPHRRDLSDDGPRTLPRRAQTLKAHSTHTDRRRSSAPLSATPTGSRASSTSTSKAQSPSPAPRRSPLANPAASSDPHLPPRTAGSPGPATATVAAGGSGGLRPPTRDRVRGRPRSSTDASSSRIPSRWDMGETVARWLDGAGLPGGSGVRRAGQSPAQTRRVDSREAGAGGGGGGERGYGAIGPSVKEDENEGEEDGGMDDGRRV